MAVMLQYKERDKTQQNFTMGIHNIIISELLECNGSEDTFLRKRQIISKQNCYCLPLHNYVSTQLVLKIYEYYLTTQL